MPSTPPVDGPLSSLVDRLVDEMADAWRRGARPSAEEFLARLPGARDEDAVRLVYEEACLRQEGGEQGVSDEVIGRFPQYRSRLALLLDCNRLLRTPPAVDFPGVGDDLGDFRLLAEIGRGAVGRTYLASQHSLAHRLMVLKVTPEGQEEHLSLARLQHMHIVPLYLEQALPDRGLRVLGMPYLGGATLARVLASLDGVPAPRRTGGQILAALDRSAVALASGVPAGGPFRKYLARAEYVQAVCLLGACLADALQYAHDRGLIHLDVKPSNVLIAADGQPMLLDFHLARGPVDPGLPAPDRLGGTPGYLSPEHRAAMAAVRGGSGPPAAVDGRSDLYSLGLLLYEALGGAPRPPGGDGAPGPPTAALNRCNPRVSPGLAAIVHKCLECDPASRYPDAAALAVDLRRHLNDQPLRWAPDRSPRERWRKFRRRHPAALAKGVLRLATVAAVVGAGAALVVQSRQRDGRIESALAEGRSLLGERRYAEATAALDRGLALGGRLPDDDPRRRALGEARLRVLRAKNSVELHELVTRLRLRSGLGTLSADESRSLLARGLGLWNSRDLLSPPGVAPVDPETEDQTRADLLDLATVWADLRVRSAPAGAAAEGLREAVDLLLDAEARFGPSPAASRDLRRYARALGRADVPSVEIPAPRTAREHDELGRSYLRTGEYESALREFERAAEIRPGEFWPYFSQAACSHHLGRYRDAVASLTVCVALDPKTPECYHNRGVAYEGLGRPDLAAADYTRALALNPGFADAALNRGVLALNAGRYALAADDFRLARSSTPGPHGRTEFAAALARLARNDWPSAKDDLRRAARRGDPVARRVFERLGLE